VVLSSRSESNPSLAHMSLVLVCRSVPGGAVEDVGVVAGRYVIVVKD